MAMSSWLFSSDSDLPSSLVNDIVEDTDGNIWIATEAGLCRFNGAAFTSYRNQSDDPHSLCHNFVRCLSLDAAGHLVIGTIDGLQTFRPETQDFSLRATNQDGQELRGNVAALNLRSNGELWVSGNVSCCVRVTPDGEVEVYDNPLTGVIDLTQGIIDDLQGIGWLIQANNELYRVTPDGRAERVTERGPDGQELGLPFSTIAVGLDGQVYAGGERAGLYRYNISSGQFEQLAPHDATFVVRDILPIYDGRMLLATDGEGLMSFDYATGIIAPYHYDNININSRNQKVHCLCVDRYGGLWMGLYQRGVATLSNKMNPFIYFGPKSHHNDCIGDKCVTHIMRDHEGLMWVTTDGGGIYCITDQGEQVHAFPASGNPGQVPTSVISLFEDRRHRFWVGSFHQGVSFLDTKNGRCTPVPILNHREVANVYDFAEDGEGRIWCASMGLGLLYYDEQAKMLVPAPYEIATQWATSLYYDELTHLLFVGSYNGLHVIDIRRPEQPAHQYIAESVVNAVTSSDNHQLLISTDMGIYIYDRSSRIITRHLLPDNTQNVMCYAAQPDGKGGIWVSGNDGLGYQDLSTGHVTRYSAYDGLQSNEFYKNASHRDADGCIWFGGTMGLSVFRPQEIQHDESPFTVRVVDLQSNAVSFAMRDDYRLNYEDNSFSLTLALQPLILTPRGQYSYRMDGDAWVTLPVGINRVSVSHLSPGQHTFYMRAMLEDRTSEVSTITIHVGYPWYLSWWLFLIIFGVLGIIGYMAVSQIVHRRAVRERLAQHVQAEAVKEAKLQFFMNISHELRTPMTLIVSPLQQLINNDTDPARQHSYSLMQRNANRILMLINQLMDIRKMDKRQMSLLCQETEVAPFILNICQTFDDLLALKKLHSSLVNELPQGQLAWLDHDAIEKVVVNLISNSIKYSVEGGSITVLLRLDPEQPDRAFQLMVTDTGVGIPAEDKEHIFDRFFQVRTGSSNVHMGTGIGLNLTHGLVKLHHGTITVCDNPEDHGTRFIITLPLSNQHLKPQEICMPALAIEIDEKKVASPATITTASIATAALSETEAEETHPVSRKQIYVVDDDDEIGRYIVQELSSHYYVQLFHNGREALDAILVQSPDLIISDIMMSEMDGISLLTRVRRNIRISHLPVILLSAKDCEEDRLEGLEVGADAYLTKPFSIDLLLKTVQNLLRSHDRLRNTFSGQQLPVDQIDLPNTKSPDERLLERVNRIIGLHISDTSLSAESVAKEVGLSRVHLYRKLKELTNQSARDYIRNIRLAKAAELLSQKKVAVAEVSMLVGFANPSNFAISFKEVYGLTPTQYMEQQLKKETDHPEK